MSPHPSPRAHARGTRLQPRGPRGPSRTNLSQVGRFFAVLILCGLEMFASSLVRGAPDLGSAPGTDSKDGGAVLSGIVRDAGTGAPLPLAVVSLVDLGRSTITDEGGRYELTAVDAGPQHVRASRIGYAPQLFHALVPGRGALTIDIHLRSEPIAVPPIDVHSAVPMPGLEAGERVEYPDRGASARAVRNHPLLSEPDFVQAVSGGEVVSRPESPSGLHVRGGGSDQVSYLVDGIPTFAPFHSGGTFSAWNPDALRRADLLSVLRSPEYGDAASGVLLASTRTPGPRFTLRGGLSTTQARSSIDGPLGDGGYLLSLRTPFPGLALHRGDASYIRGEGVDWLAKASVPAMAGALNLVAFGSSDELELAGMTSEPPPTSPSNRRNSIEWDGASVGAEWTRSAGPWTLLGRGWNVVQHASANWSSADTLSESLAARRRELGLVARAERASAARSTRAGIRAQWGRAGYVERAGSGASEAAVATVTPLGGAFLEHEERTSGALSLRVCSGAVAAEDHLRWDGGGEVRWSPLPSLSLTASLDQRHQFSQSLRNTEAVLMNIFPVDLQVGVDEGGVPVLTSRLALISGEWRPRPGLRVGAQTYTRRLRGLALVAPGATDAFGSVDFATGEGRARGLTLDAAVSDARFGAFATYALERVRYSAYDEEYTPEFAAAHSLSGGVTYYASGTASARLGFETRLGRRGTASYGPLEWESCNLLDQGCEFAGGLGGAAEAPGASRLPDYFRVDLGVRKHWHVDLAGRDASIACFGSWTNLFARRNWLAVVVNAETGQRTLVEMRPFSPLVVGLEWSF